MDLSSGWRGGEVGVGRRGESVASEVKKFEFNEKFHVRLWD